MVKTRDLTNMLSQLKIENGPIDKSVVVIDINGNPLPSGTKTILPDGDHNFTRNAMDLAVIEKAWDSFDRDLYMKVLYAKGENF